MEIWKPIVGYEWLYEVSSNGKVKSLRFWKERILKPWIGNRWHSVVVLTIGLIKNTHSIHKLVATTHIPNPLNLPIVCHKIETLDENWALYNWIDNLWWWTQSENIIDMFNKWRSRNNFKFNHPMSWKWKFWKDNHLSKTVYQYSLQGEFIREWVNAREIEKELWIIYQYISNCCLWKIRSVGGFTFTYIK